MKARTLYQQTNVSQWDQYRVKPDYYTMSCFNPSELKSPSFGGHKERELSALKNLEQRVQMFQPSGWRATKVPQRQAL